VRALVTLDEVEGEAKGVKFERDSAAAALRCFQALRGGQLSLALVEGPKAFCPQFKRAGDVQAVQSAISQPSAVTARKLPAHVKRAFGEVNFGPYSAEAMLLKLVVQAVSLSSRHCHSKNMLFECVGPLCPMQRSEEQDWLGRYPSLCLERVNVRNVKGDHEARVGVNAQ